MKVIETLLIFCALSTCAFAKQFSSAVISEKINEVTVYHTSKEPKPATVAERIDQRNVVETGRRSRAELTFPDNTITRLGSNTSFSFKSSDRRLELNKGTMLLQVPKNAGGATIFTDSVAAAIRGTTIMFEYNQGKWIKLISLEGNVELITEKAGKVKMKGGQMTFLKDDGSLLAKPVDIDLERLVKTSKLLDEELFGPLPKEAQLKIQEEISQQTTLINTGTLSRQSVKRKRDSTNLEDTVSRRTDVISAPIIPDAPTTPEEPPPVILPTIPTNPPIR